MRRIDIGNGKWIVGFLLVLGVTFLGGCSRKKPAGKVVIFHAGSLTIPFERMEKEFEARHPGVDIQREAAGSQKCARKISDLHKPCDIMASADFRVIDKLLIPEYADWNVRFATNQMVLCYTDRSKMADKVNEGNWYDILTMKGIIWGHADPDVDPCGYRALLSLQLAEKYYKRPGLYQKLLKNRPKGNIRPKSVELVSLLQTGNMDYAWEYRSVAVQHGLRFVELPVEINLSDAGYDDFYRQASLEVSGKKPGEKMVMEGKSITYGVTLLKEAPHRQAAISFLKYLLTSSDGSRILEEMGQPPYVPARIPSRAMKKQLPVELQVLVEVAP